MSFPRPKVLVSSCLGFAACRYNGQKLNSNFIENLSKFVDIVDICPEVEIGLGVPRMPIHLAKDKDKIKLIQKGNEIDFFPKMKDFSEKFLADLGKIDGAILKSKSPSCGLNNVKMENTSKESNPMNGRGVFADNLLKKLPGIACEDEGRLLNYKIREIFLTQLFTLAEFRNCKKSGKHSDLIEFHSEHKYLFMRYHQKDLTILGRIVANQEKLETTEMFEKYEKALQCLFTHTPNKAKAKNVLTHLFGYFKNNLSKDEKNFFLESMDLYVDDRIPFSSLIMIIKSWSIQYQNEYLLKQKILNPFPVELLELSDSGKKLSI